MPVFDQLQRASFGGVEFPVEEVQLRGGIRDHVHEYPHSAGGAPEKLGRKLYTVRMKGNFQATFPAWERLWPDGINALMRDFEDQRTSALVIPTVGTILAYAVDWDRTMTARVRSGETMDMTFREDQSNAFLVENLVKVSAATLSSAKEDYALAASLKKDKQFVDDSTSLLAAIESVLGFGDLPELYGDMLESKLLLVGSLCQRIDRQLDTPDNENAKILDALHVVADSATTMLEDMLDKGLRLTTYVVPVTTDVGTIAAKLYRDSARGAEILNLNPIDDAFAVRAGTVLRVYPAAA